MQGLSAYQVVQVWEWGQSKHALDRALLLLSLVDPSQTREQLAALTIGQRNRRLLELRRQTFGDQLEGVAQCGKCEERVEFGVTVSQLLLPEPAEMTFTLSLENLTIDVRLPNSGDLAAIANLDALNAGRALVERCVTSAHYDEQPLARLPDSVIPLIADAITEHDPQTEMRFALSCPACGNQWSSLFDIVTFFWTEIDARAQRLCSEVHLLAKAYRWREADILSMSARRRKLYLDWVGGT